MPVNYIPSPLGAITVINTIKTIKATNQFLSGAQGRTWRPPGWNQKALTTITVPAQTQSSSSSSGTSSQQSATVYVFDAFFRLNHNTELEITHHPVQSSSAIVDNAYTKPPTLEMEIGMSDAMDSYTAGQWSGGGAKSVNAYQIILGWQTQRLLLTVTTRLNSYSNMAVRSIVANDTYETRFGLRVNVTFEQIILATVSATSGGLVSTDMDTSGTPQSARPQTTDQTNVGTAQSTTPPQALLNQHVVPSSTYPALTPLTGIPGNGYVSSNILGANG